MSLPYRRLSGISIITLVAVSSSAVAQQTYFIPTAEATVEWNTNREMIPDPACRMRASIIA